MQRYKVKRKNKFNLLNIAHWKLDSSEIDSSEIDSSENLNRVINELKNDPNVEIVEPNYRRYPRASHPAVSYPQNNALLNDLRLPELWKVEHTNFRKQNKVKIAVIDSAFDLEHPDLKSNAYMPYNALDGGSDVSPRICVFPRTDIPKLNQNNQPYYESYGTKVMGIVGATSGNMEGIDGAGG